ncbi:hypothetical protein MLD38_023899 [Melastoma candidum]|uniref:Uncharacterized protein n=1 Tax=Melastoma candidum TaxID=119954 RepID=A0ACB9NQR1_9MYRT|nr:hypothetical protein MLD38_023899 [Melastoma candidum]
MEFEAAHDVVVLGGGRLGDLLRTFCGNTGWDYAVFWSISYQIPMVLSWEGGYCSHARSKLMPEYALDPVYYHGGSGMCSSIEDAGRESLGTIVAGMSSLYYCVGEGLVGEVAGTGNYCWLSSDDLLNYINSKTPSGFPQEWLPQISAGIKTILLVPVLPLGVLQLGSLEMISEDLEVVSNITERFVSLQNASGNSPTFLEPEDVQDLLLLPPMSYLTTDSNNYSSIIEKNLACAVDLTERELNFEETSATLEPLKEDSFGSTDDDPENRLFVSADEHAFAESYLGGFYEMAADDFPSSDLIALAFGDTVFYDIQDDILGNAFSFNMFRDFDEAFDSNISSLENDLRRNETETEYPTPEGADVGDSTSNNKESSPIEVGNRNLSTSLAEAKFISWKRKHRSEEISSTEREDLAEQSVVTTAFSTRPQDSPCSSPTSSPQSMPNSADEKDLVAKIGSDESEQEQKQPKTLGKRKGRPVENPRARPRDRQLVQDRVKELRELVPNGSKCSIDSLLAQTVKHMMFLRSVTSRAEKLRKCAPSEGSGWNRWTDLGITAEHQSGSNWAVDIRGEMQVCPIVVEDLEYPGLMLIEMMCNEHGLFLEIVEVLRRLELNIVRGSTEARANVTWASFVVEASKGFNRVDIFWPLMQLLQRTRKNTSSSS